MKKPVDVTGLRLGRLVAVKFARRAADRHSVWLWQCDCGRTVEVAANAVKNGNTRSCGCLKDEGANHRTHGATGTTELAIWESMHQRCRNPNTVNYKHYGGRGIVVCERWQRFESFLSDMGRRPSMDVTLDRVDVNGNYEPSNCRWATAKEQHRNKRNTFWVKVNGARVSLTEACEVLSLHYEKTRQRMKYKGFGVWALYAGV